MSLPTPQALVLILIFSTILVGCNKPLPVPKGAIETEVPQSELGKFIFQEMIELLPSGPETDQYFKAWNLFKSQIKPSDHLYTWKVPGTQQNGALVRRNGHIIAVFNSTYHRQPVKPPIAVIE